MQQHTTTGNFKSSKIKMTNPALTTHPITQDCTLVRAIEALGTIESTGPFERALACLLIAAYKRRLRAIAAAAPT